MKNFNYKLLEHYGTIAEDERISLEVNLISFNDAPAKIDIRRWDKENKRMLKGIAISADEAETLKNILQKI